MAPAVRSPRPGPLSSQAFKAELGQLPPADAAEASKVIEDALRDLLAHALTGQVMNSPAAQGAATPEELVYRVHRWVAPMTAQAVGKFGLSIPHDVTYSFEKLPDKTHPDGTTSMVLASVEKYEDKYVVQVDITNFILCAAMQGMTLHDLAAEQLAHELAHIAKKADPEILRSTRGLRDIGKMTVASLMASLDQTPEYQTEVNDYAEKMLSATQSVTALREGFGDYIMSDVMLEAARQGRLDDPNWTYNPDDRPSYYPAGMRFISAAVGDPSLGHRGVTRILRTPFTHGDQLPTDNEFNPPFSRWRDRAAARVLATNTAPDPVPPAVLHAHFRVLASKVNEVMRDVMPLVTARFGAHFASLDIGPLTPVRRPPRTAAGSGNPANRRSTRRTPRV